MTFKANWEKTETHASLPIKLINAMALQARPAATLLGSTLVSGGCANLNYIVNFNDASEPYILRVYIRDPMACYREAKIGELLEAYVPVPQVLYTGELEGYTFALVHYIQGITLRELLLTQPSTDRGALMKDIGLVLCKISSHSFKEPGFFDLKLNIQARTPEEKKSMSYVEYTRSCLQKTSVRNTLSPESIEKIELYLDSHGHYFPSDTEAHLVHADYDPANILVREVNGVWRVVGILDWEFSFSGSPLVDVATMLRYAHEMPDFFKSGFLDGLHSDGFILPLHWEVTVNLLNIFALLDCLSRTVTRAHPKQCADICDLIEYNLEQLKAFRSEP